MNKSKLQIVLASSSPRRRILLDQIGIRFTDLPVDIDEAIFEGESPEHYVCRVAAAKSKRGQELSGGQRPVLGADTIVVLEQSILGKPRGRSHGIEMLRRLSGCRHRVMSAVSLRAKEHLQALSVSTVSFCEITEQEAHDYWTTGEPHDKAGAYGIQGMGGLFVKRIEGSFSGVVGLPLYETSEILKKAGIGFFRGQ